MERRCKGLGETVRVAVVGLDTITALLYVWSSDHAACGGLEMMHERVRAAVCKKSPFKTVMSHFRASLPKKAARVKTSDFD